MLSHGLLCKHQNPPLCIKKALVFTLVLSSDSAKQMVRIIGMSHLHEVEITKTAFQIKTRNTFFCKCWLSTTMNAVCVSNTSSRRCFRLEVKVSSPERDELQYYSMEQPNHFPLAPGNTGRRLQDTWKNRLAALKHCMPKPSLPWNVI